jgi:hypothetical protein
MWAEVLRTGGVSHFMQRLFRCLLQGGWGGVILGAVASSASAVELRPRAIQAEQVAAAEPMDLERLAALVRDLMLMGVPHEYENTKHWGRTKEVWDGLKVSLDGWQIKTKRRKKQANHGTWKRYRVWLVEPRENLRVDISQLHRNQAGRVEFVLTLRTPLGAFGRLSEWRHDVQLYSFSVQARAEVSLQLRCDMGWTWDARHFPPDLRLDPQVLDAHLRLEDFRVQRLSDLSGPLVRELGDSLQGVLQDELDKRRDKLVRDMNDQIDEHQQYLQVSVRELLRWEKAEAVLKEIEQPHAP